MKELWYGHWFTEEFAFIFFAIAGIMIILQQKKIAISLILLGIGTILTPQIIESLKPSATQLASQTPSIVYQITKDWSILKIITVALITLFLLLRLILGKEVWNEIIGILVADFIRWIFKAPFVFISWFFKTLFNKNRK